MKCLGRTLIRLRLRDLHSVRLTSSQPQVPSEPVDAIELGVEHQNEEIIMESYSKRFAAMKSVEYQMGAPHITWSDLTLEPFHFSRLIRILPKCDKPSPIQISALSALHLEDHRFDEGRPNLVIHSRSGSGKTLAYLLAIIKRLKIDRNRPWYCQAVIVVPTRELAHQIYAVCFVFESPNIPLTSLCSF